MARLDLISRAKTKQLRFVGLTEDYTFYLPYGHLITNIVVANNTGNAVTGGLDIGTDSNDDEVLAAFTVGASALSVVPEASILKRLYSLDTVQPLIISANTAWNSADLDLWILLEKLRP